MQRRQRHDANESQLAPKRPRPLRSRLDHGLLAAWLPLAYAGWVPAAIKSRLPWPMARREPPGTGRQPCTVHILQAGWAPLCRAKIGCTGTCQSKGIGVIKQRKKQSPNPLIFEEKHPLPTRTGTAADVDACWWFGNAWMQGSGVGRRARQQFSANHERKECCGQELVGWIMTV